MVNAGCHPGDLDATLSHLDDIKNIWIFESLMTYSRWYLIQMSLANSLCSEIWVNHPDALVQGGMPYSYDKRCNPISPGGLPEGNISYRWLMSNAVCHTDAIPYHHMSSRWRWYLIQVSYGNVVMSSGWHLHPPLSHQDEIAYFDFSQHMVALQRFYMQEDPHCSKIWRHNVLIYSRHEFAISNDIWVSNLFF